MTIVIEYNLFNKIRIYESISNETNKKGSCFLIVEYQLIKENNNGDERSSMDTKASWVKVLREMALFTYFQSDSPYINYKNYIDI